MEQISSHFNPAPVGLWQLGRPARKLRACNEVHVVKTEKAGSLADASSTKIPLAKPPLPGQAMAQFGGPKSEMTEQLDGAAGNLTASANSWQEDPDVQLMLRVQAGDAFAFEQLMKRYHGRLVRILRHVCGGDESAEDLAQDVFLRVFRARANYQPSAKFSTWLFHIAHNVASNAIRDRRRRKEFQVNPPNTGSQSGLLSLDQMAMASTGAMPARRLDKVERAEMVRLAIEALNERQRMALLLCKYEGLSYQEIADAMELTVQAVKSLLSRARVNLKLMLEPYVSSGTVAGTPSAPAAGGSAADDSVSD